MILAQSSTALEGLTAREREVATLLAGGLSQTDVAEKLGIARQSVAVHACNAAKKLPGGGRPGIRIAQYHHLFQASDSP